jgi:hypothetical protein
MDNNNKSEENVKNNGRSKESFTYKEQCKIEVRSYVGGQKYRSVHLERGKRIGHMEELFLVDLLDFEEFLEDNNRLIHIEGKEGLFFYYDRVQAWNRLGLSDKQLSTLVKSLVDQGILIYHTIGIPPRRHFQINYEAVSEISKSNYNSAKRTILNSENLENLENPEFQFVQKDKLNCPKGQIALYTRKIPSKSTKEKENEIPETSASPPDPTSSALFLFIKTKIQEKDATADVPKVAWIKVLDSMIKSGRPPDEIKAAFSWAANHTFWSSKIRPPAKFKKEISAIILAMKADKSKGKNESQAVDNKAFTEKLAIEVNSRHRREYLEACPTYAEITEPNNTSQRFQLLYTEHGFQDQLKNALRKRNL